MQGVPKNTRIDARRRKTHNEFGKHFGCSLVKVISLLLAAADDAKNNNHNNRSNERKQQSNGEEEAEAEAATTTNWSAKCNVHEIKIFTLYLWFFCTGPNENCRAVSFSSFLFPALCNLKEEAKKRSNYERKEKK